MHAIALEQLVADLAAAHIGATFNQYRETGGDDASPDAPLLRLANLIRYLNAKPPAPIVMVAEAAGWRGARYSGIPQCSERQIDESATPLRRTSTHPLGWCEPSATIVQPAIAPWAHNVILWNAVPTHTRRGQAHHTNRPPTRGELAEGALFLRRLLDAVQPRHVAAEGSANCSQPGWETRNRRPLVRAPSVQDRQADAESMNPMLRRSSMGADVRFLSVLAAFWIGPWTLLTFATWLAGGAPASSPVDFVSPQRIAGRVRARASPLTPWRFVDPHRAVNTPAFWASLVAISALAAILVALVVLANRSSPRATHAPTLARRRLTTSSRWATWWDLRGMRRLRARAGSFVLGRRGGMLIVTERETSVLVVGPTRSGKTSGIVIPSLFDWSGAAVVTSTKSELVEVTGAHRQSIGPVYVYDPTGEASSMYRSITWSPITGCGSLDRAWTIAAWLCAPLQTGSGRGDNDWAHWAESGKLLIAPLLFAAASTGHTIIDVCAWIHSFDLSTPSHLLETRLAEEDDDDASDAARALGMLSAVDQRPERERGTVFSTVMRIFSAFNERAVAQSALTSRFAAEELIERRGTLYLCTPRQAPERIASLFVGILMTVVTAAYGLAERQPRGRLAADLGLFLDELANVVPIDDLPSLASQGAGRGVLLMSIVQDLSQLRSRYGADRANSILNNHGCKVILSGISDPDSADVLARLIGRGRITDVQVTRAHDGRASRAYSQRQEPLVNADTLRRLPSGAAIVVHRDRAPAIVSLRPWFRSRRLRTLARRRFFRSADYAGRKL